jgi:hypothetical protein
MKCPRCGKSLWLVRTFCPFCKTPIEAPPRPKSVTVISWITLVFGGIALLVSLLPKDPEVQRDLAQYSTQHPFLYAWLRAGPVMAVICGAFMLRGANWARWLLGLWFGYNVISNVVSSPLRLLAPRLLVGCLFGAAVYLLFRPAATAFFRGRTSEALKTLPTNETPTR